jgi:predicted acylesterase/phospholipase RssA
MAEIGVAMSGGGHRAALFGLGVLLYLADAGKNGEVSSIASVSGGSLANGYVGQSTEYRSVSATEFSAVAGQLARQIAQRGTVFAWWPVKAFLLVLVLWLVGTFALWALPLFWAWRLLLFLAALILLAKLAEQRGKLAGLAFARTLYTPPGQRKPTLLRELHTGLDHVICATEMHSGEQVYFAGGFVASYRFGWGTPADLPLHVAVQCSSGLPGAFPVRWLRTSRHQFVGGTERAAWMALADGGVYDNMADQWGQNVEARQARWPQAAALRPPDELIVVNSSGGNFWKSVGALRTPLVGELRALKRDEEILYDTSTSLRRQGLVGRFDRAELMGKGLRGALVHIPQSPFDVPTAFANSPDWPERADRAQAVLAKFAAAGESAQTWKELAARSSQVSTSLSGLGTESAAGLLRHAYLLAMANLHVILGYPLLDLPGNDRFLDLVS